MENRPPISSSPLGSINSYRKRRQRRGPNIIYIIAGVLILGGVILLIVMADWSQANRLARSLPPKPPLQH